MGGSQRGEGVWETEGVEQGRRAGKGSLGEAGRRGRGRPHTRHCLDAAIIVSSEHPGSAGSAERELNKEPGEEESGEKSARGAGSSPVGLFLRLATLLCAPPPRKHSSEMPDGDAAPPGPRGPAQGHCVGFGDGRRRCPEGGACILDLFIWRAVAVGTEFQGRSRAQNANPCSPHFPAVQRWSRSTCL